MNVIAINEYGNDWPIAVVEVPPGRTGDETFVAWARKAGRVRADWSDQKVLEESLFVWSELKVVQVWVP